MLDRYGEDFFWFPEELFSLVDRIVRALEPNSETNPAALSPDVPGMATSAVG